MSNQSSSLLSLPAEIRVQILDYLLEDNASNDIFLGCGNRGLYLDDSYSSSTILQPLLTCRQFYQDANLPAFQHTHFIISSNVFFNTDQRLAQLRPKQIETIRSIAFIADARHFRKLIEWGAHPFGISSLHLNTLTIILHRSSFWHYLFDYTTDIVTLLRSLRGVQRVLFVRNGALVKGSFRTWYNRLVGLLLKVDHHERYDREPPRPEATWWTWSYDDAAQTFALCASPPKPMLAEEAYMRQIAPLMDELRVSMENEEWNPDPRSRNMFY